MRCKKREFMEMWETVGFSILFLVGLVVGLVIGILALAVIVVSIFELPYIPFNLRIRKRVSKLRTAGFVPTCEYIRWGGGIAVDGDFVELGDVEERREGALGDVRQGLSVGGLDDGCAAARLPTPAAHREKSGDGSAEEHHDGNDCNETGHNSVARNERRHTMA